MPPLESVLIQIIEKADARLTELSARPQPYRVDATDSAQQIAWVAGYVEGHVAGIAETVAKIENRMRGLPEIVDAHQRLSDCAGLTDAQKGVLATICWVLRHPGGSGLVDRLIAAAKPRQVIQ